MSNLQDRVNQHMIEVVKREQREVMDKHNFTPDLKDATKTAVDENSLKVVIPKTMSKLQASHTLLKQFEEEETTRKYNRAYQHFFINDFMIAMQSMINKYFGMLHVSRRDTNGKPASPDYIQIPVRYENDELKTLQGYVGSIVCPCWEDAVMDIHPGHLVINVKLKFEDQVNTFLEEVEAYIRTNSVINGTAVTVTETRGGLMAQPINPKTNKKIILNDKTERIINNLIIPSLSDKSKTSLLFTGDFGTGKTETAIRVGMAGQKQFGRTFFYLHNCEIFSVLIPYLKNYQPCTVFAEDVDQISAGDRDGQMNNLLNQLDGNELKNVNATFIFTTNNHEKIHPAMRRPGRIDQVVHFDYCDKDMVAAIYQLYVGDMIGVGETDFVAAAAATPINLQGAVVAEISRRARKYAEKLHGGVISTDIFLDAIASMEHHIQFMKEDQKKDISMENLMGHIFHDSLMKAFPKLKDSNAVADGEGFTGSKYEGLN